MAFGISWVETTGVSSLRTSGSNITLPELMNEARLIELMQADRYRMGVLHLVAELDLPDGWIAGGFVRNAVWDRLHGRPMTPLNDIDVIYCDPERTEAAIDQHLEDELFARAPKKPWSVYNVARRQKDGQPGWNTCQAAMRTWPETATAVGVALGKNREIQVSAPFGLDDLFGLIVRPTHPSLAQVVQKRAHEKRWSKLWPKLKYEALKEA